jgi:hypothetical protein
MRTAAIQHYSVSMSLQLTSTMNSLHQGTGQELFQYVSSINTIEAYRTLLQLSSETRLEVRWSRHQKRDLPLSIHSNLVNGQPISAQVVEKQTGRCMTVNGIVGRHEEAIPVSYLAYRLTSLEIRPLMAYIFYFCSAISVYE